jgi:leader peptidase (prepilin peptidase)/N-methyltransferase
MAAYMGYIPITFSDACCGAISAYLFLWTISFLYTKYRKVTGIGEGDIDLLAMIGAFTGVAGWWLSLMIGSLVGSCIALCLLLTGKLSIQMRIPFGPFLALGAFIVVFLKDYVMAIIFC